VIFTSIHGCSNPAGSESPESEFVFLVQGHSPDRKLKREAPADESGRLLCGQESRKAVEPERKGSFPCMDS